MLSDCIVLIVYQTSAPNVSFMIIKWNAIGHKNVMCVCVTIFEGFTFKREACKSVFQSRFPYLTTIEYKFATLQKRSLLELSVYF